MLFHYVITVMAKRIGIQNMFLKKFTAHESVDYNS